ncbi:MAG TPA: fructosamine kinase family protein [Sphingomonas sp.]|uniref:fructosamine kinase family protein n=1 Tax=Sphingomonas sp. TaxID=28214 RepID=UPI002CB504E8|nr:fructosamine kinase family protein [Sphingomonas sp.]HMI18863.1 fructosamine kinase family protein [Sphingomonas sp.]
MTAPAEAAARLLGQPVARTRRLSGGDLSAVFYLTLADGSACIAKQADTALAEADMLRAIAATGAPAPNILAANDAWLIMEEIAHDGRLESAWPDLARMLGLLHAADGGRYGWPADHGFGPVRIENAWSENWPDFWSNRRLRCHLPYIGRALGQRIERLADRLSDLLPPQPRAALLHGDLWGGNILVAGGRVSALIDPACYHGDREVDAAMLTLFDRPPPAFFEALNLEQGWRERQPVYRLWPLLVHLRLFGDSYGDSVGAALSTLGV